MSRVRGAEDVRWDSNHINLERKTTHEMAARERERGRSCRPRRCGYRQNTGGDSSLVTVLAGNLPS